MFRFKKGKKGARPEAAEEGRHLPPFMIFSLTFIITLALLLGGIMGVLRLTLAKSSARQTQEADTLQEAGVLPAYQPTQADALTVLAIGCRERSDTPHGYTLLRLDPQKGQILIVPIPPETVVTVGVKTGTFTEHYDYAGSENVRMAAENLFLSRVDGYLRIAKSGAANLVDILGGLTCTLSEACVSGNVSVPAGTHLLSGNLLYEVALAPPKGENPLIWKGSLLKAFFEEKFSAGNGERMDFFVEAFFNNTDTSLSWLDYTSRKRGLKVLWEDGEKRAVVLLLEGISTARGENFIPEAESVAAVRAYLDPLTVE